MLKAMWFKIRVMFKWYVLKHKIKKNNISPLHPATLLAQATILQENGFHAYSPKAGKHLLVTLRLENVNELFMRLYSFKQITDKEGYLDGNNYIIKPSLKEMSLDSFLLTRKSYPVEPIEFLDELIPYLKDMISLREKYGESSTYLGYCDRKIEWVIRDIHSLTEALFQAAVTT
jgi:hypothetical protein